MATKRDHSQILSVGGNAIVGAINKFRSALTETSGFANILIHHLALGLREHREAFYLG